MPKVCALLSCNSREGITENVSFHKFPGPSDPVRRSQWITAVATHKRDPNWQPFDFHFLCSKHFTQNCFEPLISGKLPDLKKDAIPTVFSHPSSTSTQLHDNSSSPLIDQQTDDRLVHPLDLIPCTKAQMSDVLPQEEGLPTRRRRLHFPGDCSVDGSDTPRKLKQKNDVLRSAVETYKAKNKTAYQKINRLTKKNDSLKLMVKELKKQLQGSRPKVENVEKSLPLAAAQLVQRTLSGKDTRSSSYPAELREFAITLHFYSSKAYEYVRQTFKESLPHSDTIRRWDQAVDGAPGFTAEALEALQRKLETDSS